MDVRQFMESKSISDSRSVENNTDKRFQKRVLFNQHRQMRAANVVADSSSPFQTHLCGVYDDDDIYAPIQQKLLHMPESTSLWQTRIAYSSTWKRFQNRCEWSACFHGEFSLWCRNRKAFFARPFALQRKWPENYK